MATLKDKLYAEFTGTFILTFFGIAPIAKNILEDSIDGDLWVCFGWLISVALGIIIADKISGAHLNPAVSVSFYLSAYFKWKPPNSFTFIELITYSLSQLCGSYAAAALLYVIYYHHFQDKNQGKTLETASIFVTFPNDDLHENWQAFVTEVFGTFVLIIIIYCYIEKIHQFHSNTIMKAIIIGATVFTIIQSLTGIAGPALNPARDFGPRLFLLPLWGKKALSGYNHYFWIPIVGPYVGSIFGTIFFHNAFKKPFDELYFAENRNETFDESLLKQPNDVGKIQNQKIRTDYIINS
eukprot:242846_1